MGDVGFGLELSDDALLIQVLQRSKKTDVMTAKSILYQAYETNYGIHDYLGQAMQETAQTDPNNKRPLSSVALHFAEDYCAPSRLYEMIDIFVDKNVHGITGLNLQQFLELPHDVCEQVLIRCDKKQSRDAAAQASVLNSLNSTRGQ